MIPSPRTHPASPPLLGVGLLAAAVLAYELLLMRLFAIVHWHHFAFMMISIALLGYGTSGTLLTLMGQFSMGRLRWVFATATIGFSLTSVLCFAASQSLPFNALAFLWDPRQWGYLAAIYGLLLIPFLLAATGLGAMLRFYGRQITSVYAADLVGAGVGAGLTVSLLFRLPPQLALILVAGCGVAAFGAAARRWRIMGAWLTAGLLAFLALVVFGGITVISGHRDGVNPYKPLAQVLRVPGNRMLYEGHHPLGWVTAVESQSVPFRYAPGLSLNSDAPIPEQVALFVEGQAMTVVDRFDGSPRSTEYLKQCTGSLGLYLRPGAARVLVVGAGGGQDILRARAFGAQSVEAVDAHPFFAQLLHKRLREFSGFGHLEDQVRYHSTTARAFLNAAADAFDLIQLPLSGDGGAGTSAFGENTLLTVEGLTHLWRHLKEDGLVVVPLWTRLPPRGSLKAFNLALRMLEELGVRHPHEHLAVIRDWRTAVVLVAKSPLSRGDREAVRRFSRKWGFDLVFLPDLGPEEANRYSVLADPMFAEGTRTLASAEGGRFIARYKYDLRPPTDDRPFFGHYFRWQSLPEIASLRHAGGIALMDWGYPLLVATLIQAAVLSTILIGLPVWWHRQRPSVAADGRTRVMATLIYFAAIGGGFIFVEMVFIQRLSIFLHHPLLAAALALAGFLLGAGAGSIGADAALARGAPASKLLPIALVAVVVFGLLVFVALDGLIHRFIGMALTFKTALSLALILPLAVPMGTAFPLGIIVVTANRSRLVPWAWGVNGCATVLGAIAVPLLAIQAGYALIMGMALVLYAFGLMVIVRLGGLKSKRNA
ncbi:MAG: hypothetical protein QNI88_19200 [Desulfobacterales bacterium]|nr:hypothetical protein [Desulfobacterales bacterium]